MRHLFIVNPMAGKIRGKPDEAVEGINAFFRDHYPELNYDIHITRWARDALGYTRRYVLNAEKERVRVHTFGGTGTLFEIVNAVVDLPNADVAAYPMGLDNNLLQYFGSDKMHLFSSIENQLFCNTMNIDAIRCGHNYGICNAVVGLEAIINKQADRVIVKTHLNPDFCYVSIALLNVLKRKLSQEYKIMLDGQPLNGDYISIAIANHPWYTKIMGPFVDARLNDGLFDVYTTKNMSKSKFISYVPAYVTGGYKKYPEQCVHYTGRKATISSDNVLCLSIDGETFYSNNVELEIIPDAIKLVCPDGIDVDEASGVV